MNEGKVQESVEHIDRERVVRREETGERRRWRRRTIGISSERQPRERITKKEDEQRAV